MNFLCYNRNSGHFLEIRENFEIGDSRDSSSEKTPCAMTLFSRYALLQQKRVYPHPLGAGSARPNRKLVAPDPENTLFLGFSVLGGGLRPWSQTMVSGKGPDHGVVVDPETVRSFQFHILIWGALHLPLILLFLTMFVWGGNLLFTKGLVWEKTISKHNWENSNPQKGDNDSFCLHLWEL